MKKINQLTATNWKALEEFESREHTAYHSGNKSWSRPSSLTLSEVTRLLHDVRAYKTFLRELKRSKGSDNG